MGSAALSVRTIAAADTSGMLSGAGLLGPGDDALLASVGEVDCPRLASCSFSRKSARSRDSFASSLAFWDVSGLSSTCLALHHAWSSLCRSAGTFYLFIRRWREVAGNVFLRELPEAMSAA